MRISNDQDFFTARRKELSVERFLDRLHAQPLITPASRARLEAVEHFGNALGQGLGLEYYNCDSEERGRTEAHRPQGVPFPTALQVLR